MEHKSDVIGEARRESGRNETVCGAVRADRDGDGVEYWLVVQQSKNPGGDMLCNEKYFIYDTETGEGYYSDNGINRRGVRPDTLAGMYRRLAEDGSVVEDLVGGEV